MVMTIYAHVTNAAFSQDFQRLAQAFHLAIFFATRLERLPKMLSIAMSF
jgi:hypothetical protein